MSPLMVPATDAVLEVEFLEPLGLAVNISENYLEWEYGDSNNNVYYVSGEIVRWWLTLTGWERDTSYEENWWGYLSSQRSVVVESSSHFTNSDFCVWEPTTHLYYTDNIIHSHSHDNGASGYTVIASKSGGCSSLLSRQINLYD